MESIQTKQNFVDTDINSFCWKLRGSTSFSSSQNLLNKDKGALRVLMMEEHKVICIIDMDKNLGATTADKFDITKECHRQLYDQSIALNYSRIQKNELICKIKLQLKSIVETHFFKVNCFFKEAKLFLSNLNDYKIPIFSHNLEKFERSYVRRPN